MQLFHCDSKDLANKVDDWEKRRQSELKVDDFVLDKDFVEQIED